MKLTYPARFRKHGIRLIIAGLLIVEAGVLCLTYPFGPTYQGHTASWWLDQVNPGNSEDIPAPQIAAFRAMGPAAIRYLGRTWASKNLWHRDSVEERQAAAALILGGLGPDAAPALPSLVRMFHRRASYQRLMVSSTMAQISPDKLEFLTPELITDLNASHSNAEPRLEADILLLNALGPRAKSAMPALLPIAQNGDFSTMSAAVVALWNMGRETNALIECLSNSLSDHRVRVHELLFKIRSCVPLPNFITPLLEQALRHPVPSARRAAEFLLDKIDPERLRQIKEELNHRQDELLQDHLKLLQSTNSLDRCNAARALEFFGPKAAVAAPRLVEILGLPRQSSDIKGVSFADKSAALLTLKLLGSNATVVTPTLVALLQSNQFAPQICDILASIGPGAAEAIPALQALLATNYVWVTNGSAGGFGPKAFRQEIVPRWQVAQALASINPDDSHAIAILREVRHPRRRVWAQTGVEIVAQTRIRIIITLWKLGLETNLPLNELIAEGPSAFDRLGDIGPAAKNAIPALEKSLKQSSWSVDAALAICRIDPEEANRLGLPGLFIICPDKY